MEVGGAGRGEGGGVLSLSRSCLRSEECVVCVALEAINNGADYLESRGRGARTVLRYAANKYYVCVCACVRVLSLPGDVQRNL